MKKKILVAVACLIALLVAAVAFGVTPPYDLSADSVATQCVQTSTTHGHYTLPRGGDWYMLVAHTSDAFVLCGAASAEATATIGTGHFTVIDAGTTQWHRLTGPSCSYIGTATGELCFIRQKPYQ
jgi:hypothetical protein